ncbi:hypothetical protein CTI12_AA197790 [Artemisia annua]|uniref:Uncharacterized protein n=1 Tax=Artemisia annua TaxID=35608 RepID=A0A2U1P3N3_ARTAN|nr:hypothetical protein CTI12_AA197790 [Artemisia annua]
MHLWPSERLRNSFKLDYLKNLEWNLRRMKNSKNQSSGTSNEQKLLVNDDQNCANKNRSCGCVQAVFNDLVILFTCCFCCGGRDTDMEAL